MSQLDLFATSKSKVSVSETPDPDAIRERLNGILRQLRAAERVPRTAAELRSWRLVFPNMANWLPADERDALRLQFTAEVARLERL